jgi:CheY-like chemotaxis protein
MNRILAIEPDADRSVRLKHLIRENLKAEVVLATSAEAAIAAMREEHPDLILTSTLLPASDDQHLVAHLRATPALRHLPVLTIPPVIEPPAIEARSNGLFARLRRRSEPQAWLIYDAGAVVTRIEEALEQSKIAAARASKEAALAARLAEETALCEAAIVEESVVDNAEPTVPIESPLLSSDLCRRAPRLNRSDVPWLSTVKLSWGPSLRLLNISSSGMLVESGVRLSPGSPTSFKLVGQGIDLAVPARIIRCRVAEVDSFGVRYESAAAFDEPVEALLAPYSESPDATANLADLVDLVEERAASGTPCAELRAIFEAGVLELITAHDVRLRDVPLVQDDGRESIYFTIPTPDGSDAVLQVTFNAHHEPNADDFALLIAAAEAAARVLPLTHTTRQATVRPYVSVPATATLELQIA